MAQFEIGFSNTRQYPRTSTHACVDSKSAGVCFLRGSLVENVPAEIEGLRLSIEPGSLA